MMDDPIHERGKAMEDLFFAAKDQQLLENLKRELALEKDRQSLANASGIDDAAVLEQLLAQQITPQAVTAIGMIPLVAVAWADGKMEEAEKKAILQSAEDAGIKSDSSARQILEQWLTNSPPPELLDAWKHYIAALKPNVEPEFMNQLKSNILDRAEKVARSAGGILGLVHTISDAEQKKLDELAAAFE